MGTRGYGQEQRDEPSLPSTRCDKSIHGLGLRQTTIRRTRTAKFAGMSNSYVDAEFPRRQISPSDHDVLPLPGFADKALMRAPAACHATIRAHVIGSMGE